MSEYININESDEGDTLVMEDSNDRYVSVSAHFFSWKNIVFWITSIFKSLYFLKWCPIFETYPLHQFSKFNNFLWICWFLGKNISNFILPVWKLDNPCYHNFTTSIWRDFFVTAFPFTSLEIKNFTYFFSCYVSSKKLRISHMQFDEIFFHLQPILDACLKWYRWVVSNQSWD